MKWARFSHSFTYFLVTAVTCGAPPNIANAYIPSRPSRYVFDIGASVTYECKKGFEFTTSEDNVICEDDGDWSKTRPACKGEIK